MDLLISEILEKVSKVKTKKEKVDILRENDHQSLRMVIKSSFDSNIEWALPEGDVPYTRNDASEGTEHASLSYESRKLYHFIKGGDNQITQNKRETMFVQMLEGLHESEAAVLVAAKDKKLHQLYKGLSAPVVKEAFHWNDEYMIIECYRKLDPTTFTDIFDDLYLKRYATSLIKRQWGQNLSKFSDTAMLGGVKIDGATLFSTALADQQKLEEEIRTIYEEPAHMQQG